MGEWRDALMHEWARGNDIISPRSPLQSALGVQEFFLLACVLEATMDARVCLETSMGDHGYSEEPSGDATPSDKGESRTPSAH